MAGEKLVFYNRLMALLGWRFSADANQVSLPANRKAVDVSAYEDLADRFAKGPHETSGSLSAFGPRGIGAAVTELANNADTTAPITVFLEAGGAIGTRAMFARIYVTSASVGKARGEAQGVDVNFSGDGRAMLGYVMQNNVGTPITASGVAASGVELGALGAGQVLAAAVHAVDPPGIGGSGARTITVRVESDVDNTFATPITRATFTVITIDPTGLYLEIDGDVTPVSDTFWRFAWTVAGGTSPQYTLMGAAAIYAK